MWTHHGHNSQNKIHHNLEKQKDPTVQMLWRIATNTSNSKRISFIFMESASHSKVFFSKIIVFINFVLAHLRTFYS